MLTRLIPSGMPGKTGMGNEDHGQAVVGGYMPSYHQVCSRRQGGFAMAKEVKKHKPEVKMQKPNTKPMSLEEKYDRCCDFFEMDHMISYYTHKRLGTVQEWVNDTVAAYNHSVPRFLGPIAKAVTKLAPNLALKKCFDAVFNLDQQHHDISEFEYSEPEHGEIVVRWKNCARLKRHKKWIKQLGYDFDDREICEVEKMHLTHPDHPGCRMGFIPTEIVWEEGGCCWTYKRK
jgi:hypothetical protein